MSPHSNLLPYPTYKPSGIPWLGDVPGHWESPRTKTVFTERVEKGFPDEPLLAATQTLGVVRKDRYDNRTVLALKDLHLLKRVHAGDFVISLRSFEGGIEYAHDQGIISPAYTTIKAAQSYACNGYFALLFKSAPYLENLRLHVTGIREGQNIDYVKLSRSRIPLPPLPEQRAIARYLDYMDRRIQRYIRAKERLIELLEEQKRAVINQAVTRGLDPDVPLKPSGVEWLGDVPAHWEVRRLRTLANIATGGKDTVDRQDDGRYPFFVRSQTVEKIDSWSFDGEAVLTAGDGVGVGRVFHYVDGKFDFHQRVYKFSDFRDVYGRFFFHFLSAMFRFVVSQGTAKSTVDSLRLPMLQNFPVVLPKSTEQVAIVRHLDEHMMRSEKALSQTRKQIELIKEYRTRLIADVVGGKLDVRDAVAGLADDGVGVVDYPGTEA